MPSSNVSSTSSSSSGNSRAHCVDLNEFISCLLCKGYLIDAVTITECLHSFCKTCLVKYLKTNNTCPKCQTLIHETKPYQNIRSDPTLQDIVYKVVPGLYKNEMGRRRKVYGEHPEAAKTITSGEEKGEYSGERTIYSPEDIIPISLQYVPLEINYTYHGPNGSSSSSGLPSAVTTTSGEHGQVRYLKCVSAVTVRILKKLLRNKFDLKYHHDVELYYRQDLLLDTYSILDLAYIYSWKKTSPLALYYKITDLRTSAYARKKTRSAYSCKASKKDDTERQTIDEQPATSTTQPQSLDAIRQEVSQQLKVNPSPSTSLPKTEHVRTVVNGDKRSLPPTAAKMPENRPKVKKPRSEETTKPRLTSVHTGSNISKNKNIAVKKPVRPVMSNEIMKSSASQPNGLSKSHTVAEVSETSKVAETNIQGVPTILHRVSPLQTGHNGEKKQLSNGKSLEELPKNVPFTQPSSSLTNSDLNRMNRSDSLDAIRRQITSLPFTASPPLPLRPEPIRPLIQDDTNKKNSPISMVKPMKSVHDDTIPRPVSIEPLRAPIQDEAAKKYVSLNAALALAPSGISMEPLRPIPSELPKSPLPHVNGVSEAKRTHIREDVSKSPIPRVLNGTSTASTESNTITATNRTAVKSSEDKAAPLCKNAVSHVIQYDKYDSSDILLKLENCIKKSSQ